MNYAAHRFQLPPRPAVHGNAYAMLLGLLRKLHLVGRRDHGDCRQAKTGGLPQRRTCSQDPESR